MPENLQHGRRVATALPFSGILNLDVDVRFVSAEGKRREY